MRPTNFFCLLLCTCLLGACASGATEELNDVPRRGDPSDIEVDVTQVQTLADLLVRLPGVSVFERGGFTEVTVRGRRPAYAVDGLIIGYSYSDAANVVIVQDIARVDVANAIEATALYGSRGANGVIEITTVR